MFLLISWVKSLEFSTGVATYQMFLPGIMKEIYVYQ